MKINLKTAAGRPEQEAYVNLSERLPAWMTGPCRLDCTYKVTDCVDYYLLSLTVQGSLQLECRRCLQSYDFSYKNQTVLAMCESESMAEALLCDYESMVAELQQVDLTELLTDELYLYSPEKHLDSGDCDRDIYKYLSAYE